MPLESLKPDHLADGGCRVADDTLRQAIAATTAGLEGKAFTEALVRFARTDGVFGGLRRVRVLEPLSVIPIRDAQGRAYKGYKGDSNFRYDIWEIAGGRWVSEVVSMFDAHQPGWLSKVRRDHHNPRKVLSLHRDDLLAIERGAGRELMRVVKFSESQFALAPPNDGGSLKARDADKNDPFRYVYPSPNTLKAWGARQVRVDELGRVQDPGPRSRPPAQLARGVARRMDRIVDIATEGRRLSALRGFLKVDDAEGEVGRVPLDDIAAVVVHAHGVTWSTNLVTALSERGAPIVFCAANHAPVAVCLPLEGHHAQNARLRAQWSAGKPLCKQLWRKLVVAKIRWQAAALTAQGQPGTAFDIFARRVRSGDPENIEAQAARRYWPLMMGDAFRRDRDAPGANGLLNYGYTVLRALCARSVTAAGLHPSIGVHHANRGDAFALADDLIEPFRVLVDVLTLRLLAHGVEEVTPGAKRAFSALTAFDLRTSAGISPVSVVVGRSAQALARAFETRAASALVIPAPPTTLEFAGLDALAREAVVSSGAGR